MSKTPVLFLNPACFTMVISNFLIKTGIVYFYCTSHHHRPVLFYLHKQTIRGPDRGHNSTGGRHNDYAHSITKIQSQGMCDLCLCGMCIVSDTWQILCYGVLVT